MYVVGEKFFLLLLNFLPGPEWVLPSKIYRLFPGSPYRVTHQVVTNLPLTSKHKFRFGLVRSGQANHKQNFCSEVNGRFITT